MTVEDQADIPRKLPQRPDSRLGPPLDWLRGGEHRAVGRAPAVGFGKLGDALEDRGNAGHLRFWHGAAERGTHLMPAVTDQKNVLF